MAPGPLLPDATVIQGQLDLEASLAEELAKQVNRCHLHGDDGGAIADIE